MWAAIRFAVDSINQDTTLLPDYKYAAEVSRSDANALQASQSLIENTGVSLIIGGATSAETSVTQLVCRINSIPQIVALAISTTFSNKNTYPYLTRVIPNDYVQTAAIADLIRINGWKQVMMVHSDDEYGTNGLQNLNSAVSGLNVTIYTTQTTTGATNFSTNIADIKNAMDNHRVRIFILYFLITESNYIFPQMADAGLIGDSKYVYIFSYTITAYYIGYNITQNYWGNGAIGLMPRLGNGALYPQISAQYNAARAANSTRYPISSLAANWYYYDAVLTAANALQNVMDTGVSLNNVNGSMLLAAIIKTNFTGATGDISLDANYDRKGDFQWLHFSQNATASATPIAYYSDVTLSTTIVTPFSYYEGATVVSDGICTCYHGSCDDNDVCQCLAGYSGSTCNTYIISGSSFGTRNIILVAVLPAVALLVLIIFAVQYSRYKRQRIIKDVSDRQRSNISRDDITLSQAIGRGAAGIVFKGMLRGSEVAVKQLLADSAAADIVEEFELESAIMAGLRHPNIVLFMGACFVPETKEMLLVMEFMEKGSLNDVINNNRIQLPFELILHIALHAAKGMCFLHQSSPPIIHRDLKSHNILLDDKWNTRISDFGITKIKDLKSNKKGSDKHNKSLGTIYWTAPEVFEDKGHTEKSDCYSFGIVLWELTHRRVPYSGREPMSVALEVVRSGLRPIISENLDPDLKRLMIDCWAQDPDSRPTFDEIMQRLRQLSINNPVVNFGSQATRVDAPVGRAAFVYTSIVNGEALWDDLPKEMHTAINIHNNLIRTSVENFNGYEVEFTGNGFLLVFNDLKDAMNWCIATQGSLMNLSWPRALLESHYCKVVHSENKLIWNGLRVRMAVHYGSANSEVDTVSGRTKFFGPVVDKVKKILSTLHRGSIVGSSIVVEQIEISKMQLSESITFKSSAEIPDSARSKMESIYNITPISLAAREPGVPNLVEGANLPHSLVDIEEVEDITPAPPSSRIPWIISSADLSVFENVGKGAIGDFYRASWNGKEVCKKTLINQKLDEVDVLHLKARASALSKLKHNNLIEIYGVCFEPGIIGLITSYMPNSQLRAILSDQSITLSITTRVNIARQIAEGMAFLSKSDDPEISIHGNLKSGNVLVNVETGKVKLTDYGQGNLKDLARTMTSVGTVAWTAPELLNGDEPTPQISVYSFGIILYELYTRSLPYENEHPVKLVGKIMGGYRPQFPSSCPSAYKSLAERCLNGEPNMRPSWNEISNDLNAMNL